MQRRTALALLLVPLLTGLGIPVLRREIRWADLCRLGEDDLRRTETFRPTRPPRKRSSRPIYSFGGRGARARHSVT